MKIILHAAGGGLLGVGHLSRTATLAEACAATGAWERVVLLWEAEASLAALFRTPGAETRLVARREEALAARRAYALPGEQAVLVNDLLELPGDYYEAARAEGFRLLVHLNDSGTGRWRADVVVDGDAFKTARDVPAEFRGRALMGPLYRMVRSAVAARRPEAPWSGDRVRSVLVMLSGADPAGLSAALLEEWAAHAGERSVAVTVVEGPAFAPELRQRLSALAARHGWIRLLPAAPGLVEPLLAADLIVTLGGITTYEAMCLGRPVAGLEWGILGQYVRQLAALGCLENLGPAPGAAGALARLVGTPERLRRQAGRGYELIDGQGARRVAEALEQAAGGT